MGESGVPCAAFQGFCLKASRGSARTPWRIGMKWFDDYNKKCDCDNCLYRDKDYTFRECQLCTENLIENNLFYTQWKRWFPWHVRLTYFMQKRGIW